MKTIIILLAASLILSGCARSFRGGAIVRDVETNLGGNCEYTFCALGTGCSSSDEWWVDEECGKFNVGDTVYLTKTNPKLWETNLIDDSIQ